MVESAPKTIVYTDHGAALGIAKQTTMSTSSTAKLNLRLIRASEYIQRFRSLEFRHKPGKQHVVPDALSRLHAATIIDRDTTEGQLDILHSCAYTTSALVELSPELRQQILDGYQADKSWRKIIDTLDSNENAGEDAAQLPFIRDPQGLI